MLRKGAISVAAAACLAVAMLPDAALAQRHGSQGGGAAVHMSGGRGGGSGVHFNSGRSGAIHTGGVHVNRGFGVRTANFSRHRGFVRPGFRHHGRFFVRSAIVPVYTRSCWRRVHTYRGWHRVWVCRHHWTWRHHHRHWRHW
jgi:hypothetical protein